MVLDGTVPPVEKMRIYGKWDLTNKHRDLGCKATMISGYNWNNMLYGFVWKCCWNWLPFGLITGNMILIINHPNMFHWRCPMFRQTHMKVPKWPQWCFAEWLIQINGCKAHQSTNDRFVCLSNLGTVPLFLVHQGFFHMRPSNWAKSPKLHDTPQQRIRRKKKVVLTCPDYEKSISYGFWILQRIFGSMIFLENHGKSRNTWLGISSF